MEKCYIYILRCADDTFYCGWTNNLQRRIRIHNEGRGAKYTRSRLPVKIIYYEEFESYIEAQKREYQIKQLTRKQKEELIKNATDKNGDMAF